jgi:hypothetical protein
MVVSPSRVVLGQSTLLIYKSPGDRLFTPGPKGVNTNTPVSGIVPNSLLAMHANADGLAMLRRTLVSSIIMLVEKSFSNDDVECYFSLIVGACGYKADVRTTEGICANIETLRVVRSDPKKGLLRVRVR